jgi:hypothetical protein
MMALKIPALATVFLLMCGCALTEPGKAPAGNNDNAAVAAQSPAASPGHRTREEVHAEAVEAAKHHKSTMQEELDFFMQ